jgi:Protein of unknown function (DUF3237)
MSMNETSAPGTPASTLHAPKLEFAFEVRIWFTRIQSIPNMPSGAARGAVYVDRGEFSGPRLRGKLVPDSGGDYALFRPDNTVAFDARYMLQEDDGTLILLQNRGYLWGYQPDTMQRLREMIFSGGPPVSPSEYYLRASPSFEVEAGKHDWLTRHVFIGVGERKPDGNLIRYYMLL